MKRKCCPKCGKLKPYEKWMMVKVEGWGSRMIVCPECAKELQKSGGLVVSY